MKYTNLVNKHGYMKVMSALELTLTELNILLDWEANNPEGVVLLRVHVPRVVHQVTPAQMLRITLDNVRSMLLIGWYECDEEYMEDWQQGFVV